MTELGLRPDADEAHGSASADRAGTKPYLEIDVDESDIEFLRPSEQRDFFVEQLEATGVLTERHTGPSQLVFVGFDGEELRRNGTFGDRTETWGVHYDDYGSTEVDHDPVQYALEDAAELPAIAVFSTVDIIQSTADDIEWELLDPETTMDEAAVAVFYIS